MKRSQEKAIHAKYGKTAWKIVLEDPSRESGTNTHIITLGEKANEFDVKQALGRMQKNGRFMYYDQDLKSPYLHSIKKVSADDVEKMNKLENYLKHARTQEIPISKKEDQLLRMKKKLGLTGKMNNDELRRLEQLKKPKNQRFWG